MLVSIKALYFVKDKLINQTFNVMIKHVPFKFFVYSILISLVFACKNDTKIVENKYEIGADTINFQWQKFDKIFQKYENVPFIPSTLKDVIRELLF